MMDDISAEGFCLIYARSSIQNTQVIKNISTFTANSETVATQTAGVLRIETTPKLTCCSQTQEEKERSREATALANANLLSKFGHVKRTEGSEGPTAKLSCLHVCLVSVASMLGHRYRLSFV
jgi:hypothetical protein